MALKNNLTLILKIALLALVVLSTYYLTKEIPTKQHIWKHIDKIEHIALFFVLTGVSVYLFRQHFWKVIITLMMYGSLTEVFQSFITRTRKGSIGDWLANLAGILLACVVWWAIKKLMQIRSRRNNTDV